MIAQVVKEPIQLMENESRTSLQDQFILRMISSSASASWSLETTMCIFVFGSGQKCVLSFDSLLRFHEPESNVNVDDHHKVKEDRSVVSSTYINAYVSST